MEATRGPLRAGAAACRRARAPAVRSLLYLCAGGVALLLLTHSRLAGLRQLRPQPPPALLGVPADARSEYVRDERLLRQITEECAKRQDTAIYVGAAGEMVVEPATDFG